MIDWLGTIFSGLSLALQYKQQRREEEKNAKLVDVLKESTERLKRCKDIHACLQQYQLESFENFIHGFGSNPFELNKKAWEATYNAYKRLYKQHNLDVFIEKLIKELLKKTGVSVAIQKAIAVTASEDDVEILEKTYPDTLHQINKINALSEEYKTNLDQNILDFTMHNRIDSALKETLHSADRSMKALINILYNITRTI